MTTLPPSVASPAAFWDARFGAEHYVYGTAPNAFLSRQSASLQPGLSVLSVADGEGRNGVWLAEQGLDVTTVDASPEGVAKAQKLAQQRGVSLQAHCADLTNWDWPQAAFDLVVMVFLHLPPDQRPAIHRRLIQALKPGGLLIAEVFRIQQLNHSSGGPKDPDLLYTVETLQADFGDAEILELTEAAPVLDEGPFHQGPAATLQLLARRPA